MKTAVRSKLIVLLVAVVLLGLVSVLLIQLFRPEPVDPHAGQVYINDGFGMVWMTPLEGVDVNPLGQTDFRTVNGRPEYKGQDFETRRGVDVSEHQNEIDWSQVAQGDVDYAFIRAGRRGYTEGGLFEDLYYKQNIEGALANGLDVGVYFFSQAINVQEAIEEAEYVLDLLKGYRIELPVVYDWEKIEGGGARTDGLSTTTLTDCAVAFCQTVKNAGYEPAVYFNRYLGYYGYDLSRLTDYQFWAAVPGDFPDFYYASDIWQYSFSASVPGIQTEADMDLIFIPKVTATPAPEGEE